MNSEEFINAIRDVVVEGSISSVESNLIRLPGRKPQNKLVVLSTWFNKCNSEDKAIIREIIIESVETAVFGFLCVLDGVKAIEGPGEKGQLKLYYEKGGNTELLNHPEETSLHDLL